MPSFLSGHCACFTTRKLTMFFLDELFALKTLTNWCQLAAIVEAPTVVSSRTGAGTHCSFELGVLPCSSLVSWMSKLVAAGPASLGSCKCGFLGAKASVQGECVKRARGVDTLDSFLTGIGSKPCGLKIAMMRQFVRRSQDPGLSIQRR